MKHLLPVNIAAWAVKVASKRRRMLSVRRRSSFRRLIRDSFIGGGGVCDSFHWL
jgi:hypothetical protein